MRIPNYLPFASLLLSMMAVPATAAGAEWAGCYAGIQAGMAATTASFSYVELAENNWVPEDTGFSLGSEKASGVIAGGQIGCDIQAADVVVGIQGTMAAAKVSGTSDYAVAYDEQGYDSWTYTGGMRFESDWIGSVTGRLGYLVTPETLGYVKGGYAWMSVDLTDSSSFIDLDDSSYNYETVYNGSSKTVSGFTVGLGVEHRFTDKLSMFAEYVYYGFGETELRLNDVNDADWGYDAQADLHVNTFQVGMNFRF